MQIDEIVSGGARGVDALGERYARENNIDLAIFPANWKEFGKSAGYRRNQQMADYADALIALHLNNSKGTSHMIAEAERKNLKIFVVEMHSQSNQFGGSEIRKTNCDQSSSNGKEENMGMQMPLW
jgi:hypothetical protein